MVFLVYRLQLLTLSGATRYYVGAFKCPARFLEDFAAALAFRAQEHTQDSSQRGSWWCFGCTLVRQAELVSVVNERKKLLELRMALRAELVAALADKRTRRHQARGGPFCSLVPTPEEDAALAELLLWPKKKLETAIPWEFPTVARRSLLGLCFRCGAAGPSDGGHWALACPEPGFVAEPSALELAASPTGPPRPLAPAPKAKAKPKPKPKPTPKPKPKPARRTPVPVEERLRQSRVRVMKKAGGKKAFKRLEAERRAKVRAEAAAAYANAWSKAAPGSA
jgi:hypothetical protein